MEAAKPIEFQEIEEIISKKLNLKISNSNNIYFINILCYYSYLQIDIELTNDFKYYSEKFSLNKIKDISKYFLICESISDVICSIEQNINQSQITEENNNLKLIIPLNHPLCKEAIFNIPEKTKIYNNKELYEIICDLKRNNQEMKNKINNQQYIINNQQKDIKELKEKIIKVEEQINNLNKITKKEKEEENKNKIKENNNEIFLPEEKNIKNENELYSYKLLSKNNDFYIYNNLKYKIISIILENNGYLDWPENETKLICDINQSLISFNNIILPSLKKGQQEQIDIELNIPNEIPLDSYKILIDFKVNGKNIGEKLELIVKMVTEVEAFRKHYDLDEDTFSDETILKALKKEVKWEDAFNYLFN